MFRKLLAFFRLNKKSVCYVSAVGCDMHDYPDSITPHPWHFYDHICTRCGKKFNI